MTRLLIAFAAPALMFVGSVHADVRLPALFSDGMVLQRDKPLPVWGWADAGEPVSVAIAGQSKTATADTEGKWSVTLDRLAVGEPLTLEVHGKSNTVTLKDVLVGEVWLCSGQSNMLWPVKKSTNGEQAIANAANPKLRLFTVGHQPNDKPQADCRGVWKAADPSNVDDFSAVGYFFGRKLQADLNIPVGLIGASVGGTPIETWMSKPTLDAAVDAQAIYERAQKMQGQAASDDQTYTVAMNKFHEEQTAGTPTTQPKRPATLNESIYPSRLHNGMIAPLQPYAIRGAVWLQGEANVSRGAKPYENHLKLMIQSWRHDWNDADLNFGIVQLSNFQAIQTDANENSPRAALREAQANVAAALPHCGLAVAIDIGDIESIHYPNKQPSGERLADWALATIYGKADAPISPTFASMSLEGDTVRVRFKNPAGLRARDGGKITGFALAGENHKFTYADAIIDGDSVLVRSNAVKSPIVVRYAWANNPTCNLINAAGLPVAPFRTDDWPIILPNLP